LDSKQVAGWVGITDEEVDCTLPQFCQAEQEVNGSTAAAAAAVDTTITDYAYLDLMVCPSLSRPDRTLGNTSQICTEGEDLGRVVIGLYGNQVSDLYKFHHFSFTINYVVVC
jgi:hypothetical protein